MQSYRQSCQLYLLMFLSMLDHFSILANIVVLNNLFKLFCIYRKYAIFSILPFSFLDGFKTSKIRKSQKFLQLFPKRLYFEGWNLSLLAAMRRIAKSSSERLVVPQSIPLKKKMDSKNQLIRLISQIWWPRHIIFYTFS